MAGGKEATAPLAAVVSCYRQWNWVFTSWNQEKGCCTKRQQSQWLPSAPCLVSHPGSKEEPSPTSCWWGAEQPPGSPAHTNHSCCSVGVSHEGERAPGDTYQLPTSWTGAHGMSSGRGWPASVRERGVSPGHQFHANSCSWSHQPHSRAVCSLKCFFIFPAVHRWNPPFPGSVIVI